MEAIKNLGLMLKKGILKENIDSEIILWAFNKIKKKKRREKDNEITDRLQ